MPDQPTAIMPYRVATLEKQRQTDREWLGRLDEGHMTHAVTTARHEERLGALEDAVEKLAGTVNKGVWALVGFAFTIAASAVGLAISVSGGPT
jgi:hypothetical protein